MYRDVVQWSKIRHRILVKGDSRRQVARQTGISTNTIDKMVAHWSVPGCRSAFLINVARGPLIVEQDLADALNSGRIGGVAVDVLSIELPVPGNPLFNPKNCTVIPHIAWATKEARVGLLNPAIAKRASFFLDRNPVNLLSWC
jgi:phosphoglycerate dehydrogenase-like enzyme